eukprot:1158654-Pelagomonas_calceolata.AAC.3
MELIFFFCIVPLRALQLIESLAVDSEDRCLMAGRCLGELVRFHLWGRVCVHVCVCMRAHACVGKGEGKRKEGRKGERRDVWLEDEKCSVLSCWMHLLVLRMHSAAEGPAQPFNNRCITGVAYVTVWLWTKVRKLRVRACWACARAMCKFLRTCAQAGRQGAGPHHPHSEGGCALRQHHHPQGCVRGHQGGGSLLFICFCT